MRLKYIPGYEKKQRDNGSYRVPLKFMIADDKTKRR